MKVFLAVASLDPKYGGPAYSVSQLARALADSGSTVGLWAPDGSAAASDLVVDHPGIARLRGSAAEALEAFGRPDVLHDNGIWLPHNHRLAQLADRQGVPRIVSVRGMLEPWARRHKGLKKAIAWALYQRRDLRRARALHATAEAEGQTLRALGLGRPVHTIANGVDLPEAPSSSAKASPRTALFLGRIYPVKGLPMLIEAWASVRPDGWRLKIAGPDEAGHLAQVQRLVEARGLRGVVEFPGPVGGAAKEALFKEAELFVLPSHSESFGMAVAEALAHSLPVLTTTAAPWPMLEERDCGWRVEPTAAAIAKALAAATASTPERLAAKGANGRRLVAQSYSWDSAAGSFLRVYEDAVAGT
ncbi:MAG TPA: glycosyltransferase [Caulobacteraceae bacterium]